MRKNNGRMFIQNDVAYVAVVFVSVILFIGLIALQIFSGIHATRIFVGVALMFLSFAMNVFEGKFGFYISYALNFVQFMIYTYEYVMMKNESAPILLAMTFVTMVINMILQYYVIKLATKIKGIEDAKRDESSSPQRSRALKMPSVTSAARRSARNSKSRCSPVRASSLTMRQWATTRD